MVAARAAGPRRIVATQIPVSVPASRRRSSRQPNARRPGAASVVTRRRAVTAVLASLAILAGAADVRAQDPVQASVDRASVRTNESFTFVLRAEVPVRGDPETAPLAAQFDILN